MYINIHKILIGASPAIKLYILSEWKAFPEPAQAMRIKIKPGFAFEQSDKYFSGYMTGNSVQLNRQQGNIHEPAMVK